MQKKKWYQNPEMIIGLSALMVSLMAVFIGAYTAYIERTFARSSMWPRLEIFRSFSQKDEQRYFKYSVSNVGTGPALIQYAVLKFDGQVATNWSVFMELIEAEKVNFSQSHIGGRILPAEAVTEVLYTEDENLMKRLLQVGNKASIELCYCSIYDECWLTDSKNKPQPIAECQVDDTVRFLQ
ncbi:hypothetical protein [Marinicella sp. W31]|uniref:hypothetical protein n=1 Tax=Marinicella sp. W31 TaxID=3023713 RepID=UPI0037567CE7